MKLKTSLCVNSFGTEATLFSTRRLGNQHFTLRRTAPLLDHLSFIGASSCYSESKIDPGWHTGSQVIQALALAHSELFCFILEQSQDVLMWSGVRKLLDAVSSPYKQCDEQRSSEAENEGVSV